MLKPQSTQSSKSLVSMKSDATLQVIRGGVVFCHSGFGWSVVQIARALISGLQILSI